MVCYGFSSFYRSKFNYKGSIVCQRFNSSFDDLDPISCLGGLFASCCFVLMRCLENRLDCISISLPFNLSTYSSFSSGEFQKSKWEMFLMFGVFVLVILIQGIQSIPPTGEWLRSSLNLASDQSIWTMLVVTNVSEVVGPQNSWLD